MKTIQITQSFSATNGEPLGSSMFSSWPLSWHHTRPTSFYIVIYQDREIQTSLSATNQRKALGLVNSLKIWCDLSFETYHRLNFREFVALLKKKLIAQRLLNLKIRRIPLSTHIKWYRNCYPSIYGSDCLALTLICRFPSKATIIFRPPWFH